MASNKLNYKLLSGHEMPLIGFGTFQIHGRKLIRDVLDFALAAGYRSIDTAAVYGNESDIGVALKELLPKYGLTRSDIFITSKLSPSDQGNAYVALEQSIKNLDCKYLDLYLIHWPGASGIRSSDNKNAELRKLSWFQLIKARENGLVHDIGVSNYTIRHLTELFDYNSGVKPSVNQVEWHPHYFHAELKNFCRREGILLQAYSSLGGSNNSRLTTDPSVLAIAKKLNKTAAQILLRWSLQQNIAIIPKARSQKHIHENIDLNFTIPEADMNVLYNLKTREKYAWDPVVIA